jgi:hypothetical protein
MRNKVSARRRLSAGVASKFISHGNIQPGDRVILVCRVSAREQQYRGNDMDQESNLSQWVQQLGAIVIKVVRVTTSGQHPFWLLKAVQLARQFNAKLVAETTDRFIRHPAYHSEKSPNFQARESDLKELQFVTSGILLVTMVHPDATPEQVRSYQRKRGQRMKNAKGGRPERPKNRRERLFEPVRKMRLAGASLGEIAKHYGFRNRSTVARWCKGL